MMEVTNKAFKAYDVRGVYPSEVNEEMAYRVGRIFSAMFAAETVVVGHDIRLSGPALVGLVSDASGGDLRTGLSLSVIFPIFMIIGLIILKRLENKEKM